MRASPLNIAQVGVAFSVATLGAARAETLADAIALAYQSNPTLVSQRSQLQATDEDYVQAEAGFRPTAGVQVTGNYTKEPGSSLFGGTVQTETNTGTATLTVSKPLYTGGRTTAEVRAAEAEIRAGREQLRSVEATILFNVVQAYSDVLRDRASLAIQRDGFKSLQDATDEIHARYQAGANTITDFVQAQAQLEASRAAVTSAQAQLEVSNAEYVSVVGRSPGDLAPPPTLAGLPTDVDNAFDISEQENPNVRQAQYTEAVSRAQIQQARAGEHPTLSLNGSIGYTGPAEPFYGRDFDRAVAVTATFNQPIFAGGAVATPAAGEEESPSSLILPSSSTSSSSPPEDTQESAHA